MSTRPTQSGPFDFVLTDDGDRQFAFEAPFRAGFVPLLFFYRGHW